MVLPLPESMATIETRHGFTSLPPTGLVANLPARLTPFEHS